jgi:hypothetical protein
VRDPEVPNRDNIRCDVTLQMCPVVSAPLWLGFEDQQSARAFQVSLKCVDCRMQRCTLRTRRRIPTSCPSLLRKGAKSGPTISGQVAPRGAIAKQQRVWPLSNVRAVVDWTRLDGYDWAERTRFLDAPDKARRSSHTPPPIVGCTNGLNRTAAFEASMAKATHTTSTTMMCKWPGLRDNIHYDDA